MSDDRHEWLSVDDGEAMYLFDLTFLTSNWRCVYGQGCQGVLSEPAPELDQGCCSYGAHFTGADDELRVLDAAQRLTEHEWQHRGAVALSELIRTDEGGERVGALVDDACVFLNRVGFPGGPGCALHLGAIAAEARPLDWKPDVCWQLPLRLECFTEDTGREVYVLREWRRRDWGEGGSEFAWWCTEDPGAFVDERQVHETLAVEIRELVGDGPYDALVRHLAEIGDRHLLEHPVVLASRRARED